MARREKKSETLDIRLPHGQKAAFMQATRQQGETASEALRRYIDDYVIQVDQADKRNLIKEITMTLTRHKMKTLATSSLAALGVFGLAALPSAADITAFDYLDANKDGVITEGEIMPGEDGDIIAKLDLDGSGGVSPEELDAASETIVLNSEKILSDTDGKQVIKKEVKVLKFGDEADVSIAKGANTKRVIVKRIESDGGADIDIQSVINEALGEANIELESQVD